MRTRTCKKCFAPCGYGIWVNGWPYCAEHAAQKRAELEKAKHDT